MDVGQATAAFQAQLELERRHDGLCWDEDCPLHHDLAEDTEKARSAMFAAWVEAR
jgi:hypothetical protein